MAVNQRICLVCRKRGSKDIFIRLTVDWASGTIFLNDRKKQGRKMNGRSAYFCRSQVCFTAANKGSYLKQALTGRRAKTEDKQRHLSWPLPLQVIKDVINLCTQCTEDIKTCQNTRNMEA